MISDDAEAVKNFQENAPSVVNVRCENATLLGAPGNGSYVSMPF